MKGTRPGVSFVIPVHNGSEYLDDVLQSVLLQDDGRPFEVIVVEDGSRDASPRILERYRADRRVIVVAGPRRGATAALNEGIHRARYPIICQVDQDVILTPGWMTLLANALADPTIAAAQGYYATSREAGIWERAMGLDLENRYRAVCERDVDHVCTGNSAYRAEPLRQVGLFDETMGYGYDNDLSYRLVASGYRLVIEPGARSLHHWRRGFPGYLRQQYGFGYGRLDLVAKHGATRATGDAVSGLLMMLHAPMMALALALVILSALLAVAGQESFTTLALSGGILVALALERFVAGARAALALRDPAGLLFVPVHLARDIAWAAAICVWTLRRIRGTGRHPAQSMHPRPVHSLAERRTP
jgi:succinoglycan biosynthesis protein ExoA